jgi:hypothetical protein
MIIIRHTDECAGKPDASGQLTGTCDCKTAGLDQAAYKSLRRLLDKLTDESGLMQEDPEYFALRLDAIAARVVNEARSIRVRGRIKRRMTKQKQKH